jgi:hypothetical protein
VNALAACCCCVDLAAPPNLLWWLRLLLHRAVTVPVSPQGSVVGRLAWAALHISAAAAAVCTLAVCVAALVATSCIAAACWLQAWQLQARQHRPAALFHLLRLHWLLWLLLTVQLCHIWTLGIHCLLFVSKL